MVGVEIDIVIYRQLSLLALDARVRNHMLLDSFLCNFSLNIKILIPCSSKYFLRRQIFLVASKEPLVIFSYCWRCYDGQYSERFTRSQSPLHIRSNFGINVRQFDSYDLIMVFSYQMTCCSDQRQIIEFTRPSIHNKGTAKIASKRSILFVKNCPSSIFSLCVTAFFKTRCLSLETSDIH